MTYLYRIRLLQLIEELGLGVTQHNLPVPADCREMIFYTKLLLFSVVDERKMNKIGNEIKIEKYKEKQKKKVSKSI